MYIPNANTNQAEGGVTRQSNYGQTLAYITKAKPNYKGNGTDPYMDDTGGLFVAGALPIYKIPTRSYQGIYPSSLQPVPNVPYPWE